MVDQNFYIKLIYDYEAHLNSAPLLLYRKMNFYNPNKDFTIKIEGWEIMDALGGIYDFYECEPPQLILPEESLKLLFYSNDEEKQLSNREYDRIYLRSRSVKTKSGKHVITLKAKKPQKINWLQLGF